MKLLRSTVFGILMSVSLIYNADSQLIIDAQFRPRAEYSHGYASLASEGQNPSFFVSQRTRLSLSYSQERIKTRLDLQDVRLWGAQSQLTGNHDFATSVHQAWFEYEFTSGFFLKAGRQELVYDNHRIFGNVGWAQQGRTHDVALLKYENNFKVHTGFAWHQNGNRNNNLYLGPDAYKSLQFAWFQHSWENTAFSFLFLNNGIPYVSKVDTAGNPLTEKISWSQTFGPYFTWAGEKGGVVLSSYLQTGSDNARNDLFAWYLNAEGSLRLSERFTGSAGFEYLSGTDYDESGKNHSFNPFYGTNHKFNGTMDYFYVGNHINNVGLQDYYLKGSYKRNTLIVSAALHIFFSEAGIAENAEAFLGTEADLSAGWKPGENISIDLGYSQMFAGESMELLKGGDRGEINNWFWVMITVNPSVILSTE